MEMLRRFNEWLKKLMDEMEKAHKDWWEFRMDFVNKHGYDPYHSYDDEFNRF